jgi:hypothetical protein
MNKVIMSVVILWSKRIYERVRNKWDSKASSVKGRAETIEPTIAIIKDAIVATLEFSGDKAWITEYGSGHLMDLDNPYLSKYMNSGRYNWVRATEGNEFIGRAKGDKVYRPDGTVYESTGKAEGLRLEHPLGNTGQFPPYEAQEPLHIIQQEIEAAIVEIEQDIMEAIGQYMIAMIKQDVKIEL